MPRKKRPKFDLYPVAQFNGDLALAVEEVKDTREIITSAIVSAESSRLASTHPEFAQTILLLSLGKDLTWILENILHTAKLPVKETKK